MDESMSRARPATCLGFFLKRLPRFACALLCLHAGTACARETEPKPGLTVSNGVLLKEGKPYRGIGVNYCDLFQELIHSPEAQRTLKGLRLLGEKRIPFVRFWACGFWPSDWKLYFEDEAEWFARMDLLVRTAEQSGVGLIPSFFWRYQTVGDLHDEFNDEWANPSSKTRQFMAQYTQQIVTRYRNSPAIWGWEFSNEMNLRCNLPNGMQLAEQIIPNRGVNRIKHERNLITYEIAGEAFRAFASEVRKLDNHRFITTGNSIPRQSAWHNATENTWEHDNEQQAFEVFKWMSPEPMNVASVHFYPVYGETVKHAGTEGIENILRLYKSFSDRLGQPLFLGEFSASAHDHGKNLPMDQFREQQTAILDAVVSAKIDLAAHWVFDYTADRVGPGLVRADNEFAWVLDQIVEYNEKIRQQLLDEQTQQTKAQE